ncbi:MAG: hypothetical protein A4E65_03024 [Syntrophorhabdus sp. PtaU1.Bin153]|nr:MAG: hypothetical protein A4E65_03024 [Syntrophorhabdus sp. PtaU1.Bin153]
MINEQYEDDGLTLGEKIGRVRSKILLVQEVMTVGLPLDLHNGEGDTVSSGHGLTWMLGDATDELFLIEQKIIEEEKARRTGGVAGA